MEYYNRASCDEERLAALLALQRTATEQDILSMDLTFLFRLLAQGHTLPLYILAVRARSDPRPTLPALVHTLTIDDNAMLDTQLDYLAALALDKECAKALFEHSEWLIAHNALDILHSMLSHGLHEAWQCIPLLVGQPISSKRVELLVVHALSVKSVDKTMEQPLYDHTVLVFGSNIAKEPMFMLFGSLLNLYGPAFIRRVASRAPMPCTALKFCVFVAHIVAAELRVALEQSDQMTVLSASVMESLLELFAQESEHDRISTDAVKELLGLRACFRDMLGDILSFLEEQHMCLTLKTRVEAVAALALRWDQEDDAFDVSHVRLFLHDMTH